MENIKNIGIALLMVLLVFSLVIAIKGKMKMERQWKDAMENVKAYSWQYSSLESKNKAFELTVDQLKYSNDSIFQQLNNARKQLKVKDARLRSMLYVSSEFVKADTILMKDTLFRNNIGSIDTLLSDEWYSIRIGIRYPSAIMVSPEFKSTRYMVVSAKRETVNPPKKFFLLRWFQKKHTVLNVDVVERNPYIQNSTSRYVEIVK